MYSLPRAGACHPGHTMNCPLDQCGGNQHERGQMAWATQGGKHSPHLQLAAINDIDDVLNGQAGFRNVGGNHDLADPWPRALEGCPLLCRGHIRVQGNDEVRPLAVRGSGG